MKCTHWDGPAGRYCRAADGVRQYLIGPRCPDHTPARIAGRPEPPRGPGWPAGAWSTPSPQSASRVHDAIAVASGKRRTHHAAYRAAGAPLTAQPPKGGPHP